MSKLVLTGLGIILMLAVLVVILIKVIAGEKKKVKELELSLLSAKRSLASVLQHIEELSKIQKDDKEMSIKISEAKSDEEVFDIIDAIISANNDRLRDDGKDNAAAETGKK